MSEIVQQLYPYLFIGVTSFLVNIPLGYIRENTPKFSAKWLFWIHASIPLIIYLRISLGTSRLFIPICIALAVWGQIIGSRTRRKQMSVSEVDALNQVQSLRISNNTKISESKLHVALLNMGGPKTQSDVKSFQERLFCDPLLIRFPLSFLFQKLFAWILIKFRLDSVKKNYQEIGGGTPLYNSTGHQIKALKEELKKRGYHNISVTHAFNYSPPLPQNTIAQAKRLDKKYLLPLSLYPHYSKATTGSNIHYLKEEAKTNYPSLKFLDPPEYYLHDGYIQAFVDRITEQVKPGESLDDFYLLFSAHGLPLYFLTEGDPYPFQIAQTTAKVLSKLNRNDNWNIAYQSAVGPLQWLKPATDNMLQTLAREGIKKIIVVPIAFVGDHIETLLEIDVEYRELAEKWGIEDYRMSRAIESHPLFIGALADCIEKVAQKDSSKKKTSKKNYRSTASIH